jgi:hypothetical protein
MKHVSATSWFRSVFFSIIVSVPLACGVRGPRDFDEQELVASGGGQSEPNSSVAGGMGESSSSGQTSGSAGAGGASATTGAASSTGVASSSSTSTSGAGGQNSLCYEEPLDPQASVSDIVNAYGGSNYKSQVIEAMGRRYPAGGYLLQQQKNDPYFAQFSSSNSWTGMVNWLDTLVHEQTHLFNAYHAIAQNKVHALYMRSDLILYLPSDSNSFARSEVLASLSPSLAASTYAKTYLTGQQGSRGFNALLDELTCYVNEVPGLASFGEYFQGGVSLRDGAAALVNFLQVYLRLARTKYPSFYATAQSQKVYVDAVRLLWQRTHFFYKKVGDLHPQLGISDAEYRSEMHKPDNIKEISLFIGQTVDASHCLPAN